MAKFKFKYGTMGAGKSQELLRTLYNYNSRGDKVLVLTSKIDDRYGVGKVTSRTGDSKEAIAISKRIIGLKKEYKENGKNLEYRDIVILLRSVSNKAGRYQEILEKFGIPCYTDVNESFLEIPEVSLICSYLDIIENPLNDINMLAVLRSYFFKMDIDEFTRIKVVEKEITNGAKENNFYESILIYISYIKEKMDKEKNLTKQEVSFEERILYNKCLKIVSELERLKKLEEKQGLYEVVKDIVIESRLLYSN